MPRVTQLTHCILISESVLPIILRIKFNFSASSLHYFHIILKAKELPSSREITDVGSVLTPMSQELNAVW